MKVKPVLLLLSICAIIVLACHGAYKQGFKEGIQAYHNQCFYISGFLIDDAGHVVICSPMGDVSKEEMKNFKNASIVY